MGRCNVCDEQFDDATTTTCADCCEELINERRQQRRDSDATTYSMPVTDADKAFDEWWREHASVHNGLDPFGAKSPYRKVWRAAIEWMNKENEPRGATPQSDASAVIQQTPWDIAAGWYKEDEVFRGIQKHLTSDFGVALIPIPKDVSSMEFAKWLTNQYRLAMARGIRIGQGKG